MSGLRRRRSAHDPGRVLRDLAVMLADGGREISGLAVLWDRPELFGQVASTATAWRVLDSIDEVRLDAICQVPGLLEIKPRRTKQGGTAGVPGRAPGASDRDGDRREEGPGDAAGGARPGARGRVGGQPGINPDTLRGWVTQAEVDEGRRPGTTTTEAARVAELERGYSHLSGVAS